MEGYKLALMSYQHALQIRLKLFGERHPDTARSYYCIGITQHEMEDYKLALELHQHALQIRLKLFGKSHPDTAQSYYSNAVTLCAMCVKVISAWESHMKGKTRR
jgi:tetratricopeptide (TPR) repeat protein